MLFSPIHHTFAPHVTLRTVLRALGELLLPWRWRSFPLEYAFMEELEKRFDVYAFTFTSGRQALLALLKAIELQSSEEIILQAYTCAVLPNAIHAAGGTPVYADVDGDTLNLSVENVRKRITPRTRAVIAQHTFGIPANLSALRTLCDEHDLLLIEDCAHVLPEKKEETIGGQGDALILSFGRDKAISAVSGGAVLIKNPQTAEALRTLHRDSRHLPYRTCAALLLYPLLYWCARPLIGIELGKMLLAGSRAVGLLIPMLTPDEKAGRMPVMLQRMPGSLAALALTELRRLGAINQHRRDLTGFYLQAANERGWHVIPGISADLALQKFPLFFPDADRIRSLIKRYNIYLDDGWTGCTVCPRTVDLAAMNYTQGADPAAEVLCERILSLPTHPTMSIGQARYLLQKLEEAVQACENAGDRR